MNSNNVVRANERGNVLFLILIAVALFAALSYAVTQSTRSGGGDASREVKTIDVAQVLTVPVAFRTAAHRMMATKGIDGGGIVAADPSYFSSSTAEFNSRNIYHPTGGNLPYTIFPEHLLDSKYAPHQMVLNSESELQDVGATTAGGYPSIENVELMIFLAGLKKSACEAINEKVGITGMPVSRGNYGLTASAIPATYMENGGSSILGNSSTDAQLAGKLEGCYLDDGSTDIYVFYAVILPR